MTKQEWFSEIAEKSPKYPSEVLEMCWHLHLQEIEKVREEYQPINIQGLHTQYGKLYALVELPAQDSELFIKPLLAITDEK